MTLKLVISERAHQDIERNAVWWARNHSLIQAIDWQDVVYRQLETIPEMPESYSLAPENPKFDEVLRERKTSDWVLAGIVRYSLCEAMKFTS